MQSVYLITYYRYGNDGNTSAVSIVAATPLKALEKGKAVIKKKNYSDREIISIVQQSRIDGIAK